MVKKITNRLVQNDFYVILNTEGVFAEINTDKPKLVIKQDDGTTSYPYDDKDNLVSDFTEIMRIKKLLEI
jgi:hypothetical protein